MASCPNCLTEIYPEAKFCHNCGTALDPQKIQVSDPGSEIVTSAGSADKYSAVGSDKKNSNIKPDSYVRYHHGERRIVTILFADVKGSTAIAENLDPEEVLEIMNNAFKILIDPVVKYEGKVARLMGDAILSFFGAPISHEDDADRACRAALEIIEGAKVFAKKLKNEKGIENFNVRVGINTGLVVVGEVGSDSNVEYTAMGDAVNIAARMESSAKPGTVLITEETRKHLHSSFTYLHLGKIEVKGKKEPVNTFRITGLPEKIASPGSDDRFQHPFVSRKNELKLIEDLYKLLEKGKGGVISIHGENGVGKTRLFQESKKLLPPNVLWVESKAEAYAINNSYWMARTILNNYLGFLPDETISEIKIKLKNRLKRLEGDNREIERFLKYFFNIYTTDMLKFSPENFKGQVHYTIRELLIRETVNRRTVLVWDNLQWCDSTSRDLVRELIYLSQEIPLLLVLIYRLDESDKAIWDFHHSCVEASGINSTIIRLNALSTEESRQLIKSFLNAEHVPPDLMDMIYERTHGNILFTEEVLNSFLEKGIIRYKENGLETGDFHTECLVPDLLHNVLMSRIDLLEKDEKRVLQTASVIGKIFQEKLLMFLLKDVCESDRLKNILIKLQQKELILRHLPLGGNIKLLREKEYIFKFPLLQEVVYSTLLLSNRQHLHKQIGDTIEKLNKAELSEYIYSLGPHYEKGKDFTKSFEYYLKAGNKAAELFANEDAMYFYEKALGQTKFSNPGKALLNKLYESLGDAYSLATKYSFALLHYSKALKHDKDDKCSVSNIYRKIGHVYQNQGQYKKAHEYFDLSLNLIGNCNEYDAALTYSMQSMVFLREKKFEDAEKQSTLALNILLKHDDMYHLAEAYNNLGNICSATGQHDKSYKLFMECIKIREDINDVSGLAAVYNNIGNLFQSRNELDKAADSYSQSLKLCEKTGNLHGLARVCDNLCSLYTIIGNDEKAMDYNLRAVSIIGRIAKEESQINSNIWMQSGVW